MPEVHRRVINVKIIDDIQNAGMQVQLANMYIAAAHIIRRGIEKLYIMTMVGLCDILRLPIK
ncbi:hypothetical protein Ngar_c02290 [Candidatus Nitrososphaera gargensis Ga9.2]|uniref:Uncharacterized protein n=1 Tax=Nitrososphaera gargensis (strain Ga9.2) TaxID=1237085 RepID=K0IHD7_NITGG|nr:hypothetical protein Ngar_c02290 [Candidatus Nitrososphaera gargensis Ga9.2]